MAALSNYPWIPTVGPKHPHPPPKQDRIRGGFGQGAWDIEPKPTLSLGRPGGWLPGRQQQDAPEVAPGPHRRRYDAGYASLVVSELVALLVGAAASHARQGRSDGRPFCFPWIRGRVVLTATLTHQETS
jgi:hypothetical protein